MFPRSPRPRASCFGWWATRLPPATGTSPERLFTLLDAAQIGLTTKERVHRAVTTYDPAQAVTALAALDLPQPLFTAVVEVLLAECG